MHDLGAGDSACSDDDPLSPVIVLLAAGESRRFGSPKQLALINGETLIHRAARTGLATRAPLIVVTGAYADQVGAALEGLPLSLVPHSDWSQGMGGSLAAGIRAVQRLKPRALAALVWVADQPLITTAMLVTLLRQGESSTDIWATDHHGQPGPPVLFPRAYFEALAQWKGDGGAQALLRREADHVQFCMVPPGLDVDTPENLLQVRRMLENTGQEK